MNLERVGKHDEDNNSGFADGGEDRWGICARLAKCGLDCGMLLTHSNYIASHGVPERNVAGNCNEYVDESRNAYASKDHAGGSEMRVISDLVEDREHLENSIRQYSEKVQ